jgi:nitroreductase
LGDLFAAALLERDPSASTEQLDQARDKALRAPLLMLLIVDEAKGSAEIDLNERVLSAGCAVQNLMLLANAMGYGSALTSGKALKATCFRAGLGLGTSEHVICCLSVGTVSSRKPFKLRPEVQQFTRIWGDSA